MEPGIYALKTTGERVFVLKTLPDGVVEVRRPTMGENGIDHWLSTFNPIEIETLEDNFRREYKEMLLKAKIQKEILEEAREAEGEAPSLAEKLSVN